MRNMIDDLGSAKSDCCKAFVKVARGENDFLEVCGQHSSDDVYTCWYQCMKCNHACGIIIPKNNDKTMDSNKRKR